MTLACFSHCLTAEARDRAALTSLRLRTMLFKYARMVQETGRRAAHALYRRTFSLTSLPHVVRKAG